MFSCRTKKRKLCQYWLHNSDLCISELFKMKKEPENPDSFFKIDIIITDDYA